MILKIFCIKYIFSADQDKMYSLNDGGSDAGEAVGAAHEVEEGLLKLLREASSMQSGFWLKTYI
jgi:hypothetical protein